MGDFRKLGADRNSVAVNKAVGNPGIGPVRNPVTGAIANGSVVTAVWDGSLDPTKQPNGTPYGANIKVVSVPERSTGAIIIGVTGASSQFVQNWWLEGGSLFIYWNAVTDGNEVSFWVF
jgi:hypothetical protein